MFFRHWWVYITNDANCSRTLALVCGVKTLVMTDLLRPEPGRTRSILSGIMNFAKWR